MRPTLNNLIQVRSLPDDHQTHKRRVGLPAGFPFSLAGEAYGLCFISGTPALDHDAKVVPGTFKEETELAWNSVAAVAEASGCGVGHCLGAVADRP
jgi:enamine deaminase RidA (YjgF/YER057c/UK114 family)